LKTLPSKRGLGLVCLLLLGLFLIRPPADYLRGRVSQSISLALGRHVELSSLHLRFLPRPGFVLENLLIRDDAEFGAEPFLRSPDVTAWLRVTALLHGRIEIASLSLSEASLNLARDQQGKWNLEDLLRRTANISTAPTASGKRESRPEFPYIEATQARINFKVGTEKTHFAFTDAQFALWQESENTWGVRLEARPIRTDANLTDTGLINVSGIWRRAPVLHETPVQFSFAWNQAQIGQVSKLIYGSDQGWRGGVILSGTLSGTPGDLRITADSSIDDFRRYDVFGNGPLRLVAHCAAEYSSFEKTLSNVDCSAPVGDGSLDLKGSASGWPLSSYSWSLVASRVPAQAVVELARHSKGNIPDDLVAIGSVNTTLMFSRSDFAEPQWSGDGELQEFTLSSGNNASELVLGRVRFSLSSLVVSAAQLSEAKVPKTKGNRASDTGPRLEIGPVNVVLGRAVPLQARASLSLSGYQASVHGDAGIKRLLQVAHTLGIPAPAVTADGSSTVDLTIAGTWRGIQRPMILGTAQLRSVRAQVRGLNAPLQIASASLVLNQDSVIVQNLNASAAEEVWRGSLRMSRPCPVPRDCTLQFSLHAAEVSAAALNELLNPQARKKSWYKFLTSRETQLPYLLQARAGGRITIDKLLLGKSACTRFTSDVDLDQGKLTLVNMRGEFLGGGVTGVWKADFSARPPVYQGAGSLENLALAQIADLTHDEWIDGTGTARYEVKAAGWGLHDLPDSTDLSASFAIKDGEFPHIVLTTKSGPLHASSFSGKVLLHEGKFSFEDAKLDTATGVYKVSGSAFLTGALNLKMVGESTTGYGLAGTLIKTRVTPIPATATQAALKP